jgi:hypothetical protein
MPGDAKMHGRPGGCTVSIVTGMADGRAVLGQVITAVEDFLDHQVWPRRNDEGNG